MKISATLTALLLFAATGLSLAQEPAASGHASISAQEFIEKAGAGGLAEVDMGELGSKKATSRQVKATTKGWTKISFAILESSGRRKTLASRHHRK